MDVRKAKEQDLEKIVPLFKAAIRSMEEKGIHQWDEIYPDEKVLREDITRGDMYVCELGGAVAAVFALNRECNPEYEEGAWRYPAAGYAVLHRLCVDPGFQGAGVGAKAVLAAESVLRDRGTEVLRLDAFLHNPAALRLYDKLGYERVGQIRLRKGPFYLYEKKL